MIGVANAPYHFVDPCLANATLREKVAAAGYIEARARAVNAVPQ
jgi:hypothetical protein